MKGERCAERPGSGMLLWQHEYYFVIEKYNGGPPKPYIYQALEFRKGSELPEIEKENIASIEENVVQDTPKKRGFPNRKSKIETKYDYEAELAFREKGK